MEITDVLPPPNHENLQVLIMAGTYMLLFLLGTSGNVTVLTTIYHVILGFWMFGTVICKLHAVLENFGKILSSLIITAMCVDRYVSVCHLQQKWFRSRRLAVTILTGLAFYAVVTLCPFLWSFKARQLVLFEKETAPLKLTRMTIEKCTMVNISSFLFILFIIYLFVFCYCLPLSLVTFSYVKLLKRLRQHARQFKIFSRSIKHTSVIGELKNLSSVRNLKQRTLQTIALQSSRLPLMRISMYTLAVAYFYFLCWTPFRLATVHAVYLEYAGDKNGHAAPLFVNFMYFVHALRLPILDTIWLCVLDGQLQARMVANNLKSVITLAEPSGIATATSQKKGNQYRTAES
uniref:G-protein coupled receptors family 1 profile domain-containing protein n=1 Tax=Setaria digitata TaxID=48799 RepID=A0A915PT76_9BILA